MATATAPEWEQEELGLTFSPPRITPLADGSYRVQPGKPVPLPTYVSVRKASKLLGLSPRRVQEIARELGARQRGPRCLLRLPLDAVREAAGRLA
jgi:hypothetical protein